MAIKMVTTPFLLVFLLCFWPVLPLHRFWPRYPAPLATIAGRALRETGVARPALTSFWGEHIAQVFPPVRVSMCTSSTPREPF